MAISGCGSDDAATTPATTAATGATDVVRQTSSTGATAVAEPTEPAADPNEPGEGDEEAVRSDVSIGLKGGGFTQGTPRKVHVPSSIPIELSIKVEDNETYNLVVSVDGRDRLATYTKPGSYKLTIDGLKTRQTATVVLGGEQQIKITADADPGP